MSEQIVRQELLGYRLGLACALSPTQGAALLKLLAQPCGEQNSALGGRRSASYGVLPGIGNVVVKHYHRGGVFGKLVNSSYVRWGPTRSQAEFELLRRVRSLGVSAPEPVAFAFRGSILYRAWLVTREVEGHQSLASLSSSAEEAARRLTEELAEQIAILVNARIYHIDLHPGNVLVDRSGHMFLIDFDKAQEHRGSKNDLRDMYLVRWRRAVIKHVLPEFLSEILSASLRRPFEG